MFKKIAVDLFDKTRVIAKSASDELVSRVRDEKLTPGEVSVFADLLKISRLESFKSTFPAIRKIPSRENLLNKRDIRALIATEGLVEKLPGFLKEYELFQKQEEERIRKESEAREAAERNKSYFSFWAYTGTLYGGAKYKDRSGDIIYPVTEFFISTEKGGDKQVKLERYDLPIANGQKVSIIYACPQGRNTGYPVQYVNFNLNTATSLKEYVNKVNRSAGYYMDHSRFEFELKRFKQNRWI